MKRIIKKIIPRGLLQILRNIRNSIAPTAMIKEERKQLLERAQFFSQFVHTGDLCFDVGANTGNRVIPMLKNGAQVVAVEPQESCYRALEKKFGSTIRIVKKGVDEKKGVKDFYISDSSTISTFSEEWLQQVKNNRFKGQEWNKKVRVEMTTLNDLVTEFGLPAFIKIDVEGFELQVLKGLSHPVQLVSFEYAVPEQKQSLIQCVAHLQSLSSKYEFNFCVGEQMQFHLTQWLNGTAMQALMANDNGEFILSGWGDIYARIKKNGTDA
jgi:FkbM family methyltransferase